jgi:nucleoid DNA-binding protein
MSNTKQAKANPKGMTKTELKKSLADKAGVSLQQAGLMLDSLTEIAVNELGKKDGGSFTIPGVVKIKVVRKSPTAAKEMYSHLKKEIIQVAAKPARNIVKAQCLKAVKEAVL